MSDVDCSALAEADGVKRGVPDCDSDCACDGGASDGGGDTAFVVDVSGGGGIVVSCGVAVVSFVGALSVRFASVATGVGVGGVGDTVESTSLSIGAGVDIRKYDKGDG